jgi:RNA polymerase sigma-70 factor (ECF subfamily)
MGQGTRVTASEQRLRAWMLDALAGDRAAYGALLTEMGALLKRFFERRLSDATEAEDLVQDTLLAIHTRRATYDPSRPFTAWAYAIARYKLIDHLRRRRVRPTVPLDDNVHELFAPDDHEAVMAGADLDRLMRDLPASQSQAIRDVKLSGFSSVEAAARAGINEGAMKVRVHRGLKALAARVRGGPDADR